MFGSSSEPSPSLSAAVPTLTMPSGSRAIPALANTQVHLTHLHRAYSLLDSLTLCVIYLETACRTVLAVICMCNTLYVTWSSEGGFIHAEACSVSDTCLVQYGCTVLKRCVGYVSDLQLVSSCLWCEDIG